MYTYIEVKEKVRRKEGEKKKEKKERKEREREKKKTGKRRKGEIIGPNLKAEFDPFIPFISSFSGMPKLRLQSSLPDTA